MVDPASYGGRSISKTSSSSHRHKHCIGHELSNILSTSEDVTCVEESTKSVRGEGEEEEDKLESEQEEEEDQSRESCCCTHHKNHNCCCSSRHTPISRVI
jgi:hypothetical protein